MKCQECRDRKFIKEIDSGVWWCDRIKGFVNHYVWFFLTNENCPLNQKKEEEKNK